LVSIVVPMKDEEGSLPLLAEELDGLASSLLERDATLEVVLVDDGSTDATGDVSRALCASREGWRVITHDVNRGFGAGLRSGTAAARGDVIVSYDADCAYPASDVLLMLDVLASGADIASATPFGDDDDAEADAPIWRLALSHGCSLAYRIALRGRARGLRTFTCAFRAYRADTLRAAAWQADGFLAAAEIVSRSLLAGARVVEVPSQLRPRVAGVSKMKVVRTTFAHFGLLTRLVFARPSPRVATATLAGSIA